jgi:hypothetical protein
MSAQVVTGILVPEMASPEFLIAALCTEVQEIDPAAYAKLLVKWGTAFGKKATASWIKKHPAEAENLKQDLAKSLSEVVSDQGYYFGVSSNGDWGYWPLPTASESK